MKNEGAYITILVYKVSHLRTRGGGGGAWEVSRPWPPGKSQSRRAYPPRAQHGGCRRDYSLGPNGNEPIAIKYFIPITVIRRLRFL